MICPVSGVRTASGVFRFLLTRRAKEINFSKVKLKPIILYSFLTASLMGCAGVNAKTDIMARQIDELKASLNETNTRVDDLNNKFMLLLEKVEASKSDIEKLNTASPAPPEGLKVVSLGTEGEKKAGDYGAKKEDGAAPFVQAQPVKEAKASTPETLYNRGQDLFLAGRFNEARGVFQALVKSFPSSDLADNALYWEGETYYSEKDFYKAADKFMEVPEKYPAGNKAPDAFLKAGFSYLEVYSGAKAKELFDRLIKAYPGSEAADKAKKAIAKLKDGNR